MLSAASAKLKWQLTNNNNEAGMKLRHSLLSTALLGIFALPLHAVQGYYRSAVLQQDQIVFTAEGDLWQASLDNMTARRL
ncbi:MAG: tricorn protease, partial [Rheinheimera aquimaris]